MCTAQSDPRTARHEPDIEVRRLWRTEMAAAGCELHADLTALAVMWFLRVLLNIHKFLHLASRADRYFRHHRPDAVVLIDYPGFNWWIARRAKAHGIPVFYYCPPQIWAWASWRIKKMRRFVDHVLCALPFEETWFRRARLPGHVRGPSVFRRSPRSRNSTKHFWQQLRAKPAGWSRFCPARGRRKSSTT